MPVVVLAAMRSELRPFVRATGLRAADDRYTGRFAGCEIVATTMGVGMVRARDTADKVVRSIDADRVERVVVIGIAGGLDTSLPIGHVLTPEVVVDGAAGTEHRPSAWAPIRPHGRLVSFNDFLTEAAVLGALQRDGYAAIDMETAAVADVCELHSCPYAVFRAISDNATDGSVDAAVAALARPDGTPDVRAALGYVLRRPWQVPHLAHLGRDAQRASAAAATAAVEALRAGSAS